MYPTNNTAWDLTRAYIGTAIMAILTTAELYWGYTKFFQHTLLMGGLFLIGVLIWRVGR